MDYYIKLANLDKDKLLSEIEQLSNKLFKSKPESSVHMQLLQMHGEARQMYEEKLFIERQGQMQDTAIDIGQIDSVVITPDYSDEQIITITVDSYRDKI